LFWQRQRAHAQVVVIEEWGGLCDCVSFSQSHQRLTCTPHLSLPRPSCYPIASSPNTYKNATDTSRLSLALLHTTRHLFVCVCLGMCCDLSVWPLFFLFLCLISFLLSDQFGRRPELNRHRYQIGPRASQVPSSSLPSWEGLSCQHWYHHRCPSPLQREHLQQSVRQQTFQLERQTISSAEPLRAAFY
jgi:hypothetical protein